MLGMIDFDWVEEVIDSFLGKEKCIHIVLGCGILKRASDHEMNCFADQYCGVWKIL